MQIFGYADHVYKMYAIEYIDNKLSKGKKYLSLVNRLILEFALIY